MLIKYILILCIAILFLFNNSVKAEVNDYITGDKNSKIIERIDSFFTEHPNKKNVFWLPEIKGKSRYSFSIPKNAYIISKKYLDASDLYYLSEKIDHGMQLKPYKSNSINIFILKNNYKAIFNQRFLSNINAGLFLEKKENSLGMILNKDFIISKDAIGNFGFVQPIDGHTIFNAKFVSLSENENSELYGNINHEFKSNVLNADIGFTWFEIANQFDFTLNIKQDNKKITSDIYATIYEEKVNFQIGLKKSKNNSKTNIFLNLSFENILNKKHYDSRVTISSENNMNINNKLSLKKFRKHSLDSLWRKKIKF